jgi:molybdopterin synthase catalytic subunit
VRVVSLSSTPIDPGALLAAFIAGRTDTGGVVSFTGLVRAEDGVEALELEAYEGFTEPAISVTMAAMAGSVSPWCSWRPQLVIAARRSRRRTI